MFVTKNKNRTLCSEWLSHNQLKSFQELKEHVGRYRFASQFTKNRMVLDIACGSGYGSAYLLVKGAREVVGCDISKEAIAEAVRFYKKSNLHFIVASATYLPFRDSTFDAIVSIETIEHISDDEKFLTECKRALKKGSIFICSTPNRIATLTYGLIFPYHIREYSISEFHRILSKHFSEIKIYGMLSSSFKVNPLWTRFRRLAFQICLKVIRYIPTVKPLLVNFHLLLTMKFIRYAKLSDIDPKFFDNIFPELGISLVENLKNLPSHIIGIAYNPE
jgi:ubiquinone/menaquinone biosynthesis C-methylase UbiE